MCGIVGLFLKNKAMEPQFGPLLAEMLGVMTDRGPDSAGFAVYGEKAPGSWKMTVRHDHAASVAAALAQAIGAPVTVTARDSHSVLTLPETHQALAREWLAANCPEMTICGDGRSIELYKEIGLPAQVADRFGLRAMAGSHGIGHTRMATESAVTTAGAHPFSTGPDQCLVHNGSLSNHASLRRMLIREGMHFSTDNDSEVAAGYLTWKMAGGATLAQALEAALTDLDGFYTFVVGTETGFAVVRDPISCKPAVMAETDDLVAFASEYRALTGLPGIAGASIFEPEPARVYAWEHA
ncbi:MAG: glutamine amidotransferase [Novosphingobium sp. 28-62-57]|nr:MAG: glutamine amidotransferase [Novosphingobium sp. 12-63-9]OYZ10885.1 MAG: glutamine amidotransferase [Novosphingobium sp. 28-62-57]OZA31409.1 MAG: glutamine amidotransferase [Novosphingobium sp. 17-62-9]HQS68553.1 glutamine amidotransferase family protein [Novosphingobium sp.]